MKKGDRVKVGGTKSILTVIRGEEVDGQMFIEVKERVCLIPKNILIKIKRDENTNEQKKRRYLHTTAVNMSRLTII